MMLLRADVLAWIVSSFFKIKDKMENLSLDQELDYLRKKCQEQQAKIIEYEIIIQTINSEIDRALRLNKTEYNQNASC